jgi:hypothetical protein
MPTTYVLVIIASDTEDRLYDLHGRQDERTFKTYFENETLTDVKVCYVSE